MSTWHWKVCWSIVAAVAFALLAGIFEAFIGIKLGIVFLGFAWIGIWRFWREDQNTPPWVKKPPADSQPEKSS